MIENSYLIINSSGRVQEFEYTNRIAIHVWTTIPIVFLVLGTISNLFSIMVFMRRDMRKYSAFVYFGVLNIVNLALIYVTFMRVIMEFNFKKDLRVINMFFCKIHVFLTYFLGHLSSLLICTISIDRVISVVFIQKARLLCTPKIAWIVTACLAMLNFCISGHFLFLKSGYIEVSNSTNKVNCEPPEDTAYFLFISNAWKIIDMSIFAIVPFIIMSVCSVIIIIRVAEQSKRVKTHKSREASALLNKSENAARKQSEEVMKKPVVRQKTQSKAENKFSSRTRNLALMLIPVNVLFLIFLAPVVMTMYFYPSLDRDKLTLAIVELLATCNYTFNFIIYFLTSSKFREEFFKSINELISIFFKNSNQMRTNQ